MPFKSPKSGRIRNIKLVIEYDGSPFFGFQRQPHHPTIQEALEKALSKLLNKKTKITAASGRTDTGVHAREFYAHFDSEKGNLHDEKHQWLYKINKCLPNDIGVTAILPMVPDASARFSAFARTYHYCIHQKPNPFLNNTSWFLYGSLDIDLMNEAAEIIKGTTDFESFAKKNNNHNHYTCKVYEAGWKKENDKIIFTVRANRFLRNMVRALVGTMVDVGTKKITLEEFREIIKSGSRAQAGTSVPAQGLHLLKIEYPAAIFL